MIRARARATRRKLNGRTFLTRKKRYACENFPIYGMAYGLFISFDVTSGLTSSFLTK